MEENTKITYTTNSFRTGSLLENVMLATFLGMTVMTIGIFAGLHIFLNTAILLISIYLVIRWRSGRAIYAIDRNGFSQYITPFISGKPVLREYHWNDVRSYTSGSDMNRGYEEYNYLKIKLRKKPHTISITDQKGDKEGFQAFLQAFENGVDGGGKETLIREPLKATESNVSSNFTERRSSKKRPSFYKRPFAKLLTLIFVVLCVLLVGFWSQGMLAPRNLFRLLAIIIPGTIYMVKRVFIDK